MRQSVFIGRTLRETPSEAEFVAHQLGLRAGLFRPVLAGGVALLPLAMRVLRRIEAIMHAELAAIDAQEVRTPVVQPRSLWEQSGRAEIYGPTMLQATNRNEQGVVIGPTHEEAMALLAKLMIDSYRQLPALVYQIHTKYRDELRVRGGLMRLREFTMLDAYSFDVDAAGLERSYAAVAGAFERIFARVGVDVVPVTASAGDMGGSVTVEYMALSAMGEDWLALCDCGYAANREVARRGAAAPFAGAAAAVEEIATPDCTTIAELCALLGIEAAATAKAVFLRSERGIVFAVVRGDHEVNEEKLRAALGVKGLEPATAEEIGALGAVPGYASPMNVRGATVVADPAVLAAGPLVAGANRVGWHAKNVVAGRDWEPTLVADIAEVVAGDACPECGAALRLEKGVELGHVFQLGARYAEALEALALGADGEARPLVMGSYGIGLERLIQVIIEQHHDADGIIWPEAIAPFDVHLVRLGGSATAAEAAEAAYGELQAKGYAVLYDDRSESAGVKFKDADLIGAPWRLVISDRGLKAGVFELRERATGAVHEWRMGAGLPR